MNPDFSRIIRSNEKIEKLAGAFKFTEGPVWFAGKRELLFSDIPADRIVRWVPRKEGSAVETFRTPSGQSNGLTLDKQGRLIACEHANRRVTRTEADGTITVLADRFEGKRLNSPNDVVVKSDGTIYFTDPPYGVDSKLRELDFQGVYRIANNGETLALLVRDFNKPNGLAFSPDEKVLYIADTEGTAETNGGFIRAYDVAADGTLANGRIFTQVPGPDGMKVDVEGNVYCTASDGVEVFSPSGKKLGVISPAEQPANCAFGDADWKTLYMTCRTGLYRIRVNIAGVKVP